MSNNEINVIGAGLAGCEAAWQIAERGIKVNLYDMKPKKFSPAHKSENLCELVCSNSFKAERIDSAAGLLKEELRKMNSLVVSCADKCKVPAGGALAVDRDKFSGMVTDKIKNHKNINFISEEISDLPEGITIIATGPLTSESLSGKISKICGEKLSFFDAAAPIISSESIDMNHAFFASRYGKGDGKDYLNCPLTEEEYTEFYNNLILAERAPLHDVDVSNPKVYEGCIPVEVMAQRGFDTLRYGPMKPVGLRDPKEPEKRPFAIVQLRKENLDGTMYNMVGFQTNLKFPEQRRVFGMIPALKNADFIRYGVMHRNTFINSPKILNPDYSMRDDTNIFFAGQITGVEGYMESVSSGLVAGINAALRRTGKGECVFPKFTMIGALANYAANSESEDFQPMGANFGILPPLDELIKDKKMRYNEFAKRSLMYFEDRFSK
ncbi:MAG: methylenetetrahydrofolate--tRNA-(uracil(54)-C(5))-methyltransferase (FADH(2)-oxidizing) TrmFO [Clostridia bacterium]|nr:methylenetetrahydrofolate--tRNA-(uracil(54)-C(5))-methyltransferase (FADH(2)-oxidizing) TrmFO [Clostridia bacterium]